MEYGNIPGIDKPISRLVQGTVMLSMNKFEESMELLDGVYALGCTTFDTAHGYGNGDCERTLGHWYNERGLRDKIVVLGKGAHHNRDRERVTPYDITSDLFDSLARQKTDFIDLYVLHRDDPSVSVGPIVEVLNEHHDAGRIGAFGGSNWTTARIEEANEYADKHELSLPQIATAYVMSYPLNIFALVGCANADEYKANMEAMTLKLTLEEVEWLNFGVDSSRI